MAKEQEDIELDLYGMASDEYRIRLMAYRDRWRQSLAKRQALGELDWELFEQMALRGVPINQMTYIFQTTIAKLDEDCTAMYGLSLDDYVATARATMLAIIRNMQLTKRDTSMLKHLGEWYLDQRENAGNERLIKDLEIKIIYTEASELDGIDTEGSLW